jgi:non-lysosomal glucosylceramidase
VWTGNENQVAAHLIYRGLIDEGLALVKATGDRYDGVRRNPWNQIEWGNHYSRALASYSVLLALSGFRYSAVTQTATFQPRVQEENFACFFAAGTAWGLFRQQRSASLITAKLECRHGELKLRHLILAEHAKLGPEVNVSLTAAEGRKIACTAMNDAAGLQIQFPEQVVIAEGQSVTVSVSAKPVSPAKKR